MEKRRVFRTLLVIGLFAAGVIIQLQYGKGTFNGATMLAIALILSALAIFYLGEDRIYSFFKKQIDLLIKEPEKTPIYEIKRANITVKKAVILEFPKKR